MEEDIDYLASYIINKLEDDTLKIQVRSICRFLLRVEKKTLDNCIKLVDKKSFKRLFNKLLLSESRFHDPTPTPFGLDLITEITAATFQESLNVKHFKKINETICMDDTFERIIPNIKYDILYSHPVYIWIRFHAKNDILNNATLNNMTLIHLSESIYEVYFLKTTESMDRCKIYNIIRDIDNSGSDVIFCSELSYFKASPKHYCSLQVFMSNFIKFMFCYKLNRLIFDPDSFQDDKNLLIYMTYGHLFYMTDYKNKVISSMPQDTHGPLIAISAERPKTALGKFSSKKKYNIVGTRSVQAIDKGVDYGASSNYIVINSKLDFDDSICLDSII